MHLHVLTHHSAVANLDGLSAGLVEHAHRVETDALAADSVPAAAELGHHLAVRWRQDRPDAIVALGWLAGLAAQIGSRGLDVPVVQRLYSPGLSRDPERRRLEGAIGRGATRVLALCSRDVEQLVALGVRRSAVRVVPHGVDTSAFTDEGPRWPAGEARRLVARPLDTAAAARLIALLPQLPRCELVLLTDPTTRAGATGALADAVEQYPIASRVRLVDLESGDRGVAALAALLRSTDLVLAVDDEQPSLDLVLQAMASGVPVVAPTVGALHGIVADGVTGVLVGPGSPTALADAIRSLLGDGLSRESQGLAAGDRARASFGWPAVAAAITRVADELVPAGSPSSWAAGQVG